MRVTFDVPELKQRLGQLGQVVARKSQEALYRNIRLFTDADGLVSMQGIDIDTTMTLKLAKAKADAAVNVLLEYSILNETVPHLTDKVVFIDIKGETEAVLSSGKFKARLKTFPTTAFTELPLVQGIAEKPEIGGYAFGLPGLKDQIDLVDFAVPAAEGKHVVASALLRATLTDFSVVATDGVVLAISTVPSDLGEFSFTMPKPALELIKKMDGGGKITISDTEGAFFLETETELITYNKTHAEFPHYETIVPKPGAYPVALTFKDKAELVSTLTRIKPFCFDKEHPAVNFEFDGTDTVSLIAVKEETLATGNVYTDMSTDNVTVEGTGGAAKIKLDIKKVLPFFERATFPVVLKLAGGTKIADIHGNGGTNEKPTYRFLIMPMRGTEGASSSPIPTTE